MVPSWAHGRTASGADQRDCRSDRMTWTPAAHAPPPPAAPSVPAAAQTVQPAPPPAAGRHALMPTSVLPASVRALFPYPTFNAMQTATFDDAYGSDASLVVAAPTGSGKTAVLELAIARLFGGSYGGGGTGGGGRGRGSLAVYMAPLKALTHERLLDWKAKLGGLSVVELTGDSDDASDERAVAGADLVLTTPEKFDAFSRFRRDAQGVIGRVGLLLVDEVHMCVVRPLERCGAHAARVHCYH
jgi:ATP-dependent DNA helicase HFM1/MER3